MTINDLEELRAFLFEQIEDLDELEILVWFHRHPSADWVSGAQIAETLPFPAERTVEVLERLSARQLLVREAGAPRYRCAPSDADTRAILDRVLSAYDANPLQLYRLMNANAIERVKTAAIRTFAECFRVGGPKSNG